MERYTNGVELQQLGKRINAVRKDKQISSELLSEMVGKSSGGYIRMLEAGRNGISLGAFVDICNALDVSSDYLLSDSMLRSYNFPDQLDLLKPSQLSIIHRLIAVMIEDNKSSEDD